MPAAAQLTARKVLVGTACTVSGPVLWSEEPINFLGSVDKGTGEITDRNHGLYGRSIGGAILAFPSGAGSSVGAYTIYALKSGGSAPLAMICKRADLTVAAGCAVAGIPLVTVNADSFETLATGLRVELDTRSRRIRLLR